MASKQFSRLLNLCSLAIAPIFSFTQCLKRLLMTIKLKHEGRERWQTQIKGVGTIVESPFFRPLTAQVAHIAAPVLPRIAIEQLNVETSLWNPDAVVAMGLRRKIAHRQRKLIRIFSAAYKGDYAVAIIITVHPFKAIVGKILRVERRLSAIQVI